MTREEFEELIGRKVDDAEYAKADALYLMTKMNKFDFCNILKKTGFNLIYQELADNIEAKGEYIAKQAKRDRAASDLLLTILMSDSLTQSESEALSKAISLMTSYEKMIIGKLKNGICLTLDEIKYIEGKLTV